MRYVTSIDGREYQVEILDEHHVSVDGAVYIIDFLPISDQPVYSLIVNGQSFDTQVYPEDDQWQVIFKGALYSASVEDEREKRLRATMGGVISESEEYHLQAPMPDGVGLAPTIFPWVAPITSARWSIPEGWRLRLFDRPACTGGSLDLMGTGEVDDLAVLGFDDRLACARWLQATESAATPDPAPGM